MVDAVKDWLRAHEAIFWWFGVFTVLSYIAIPFVIRAVVIRMSPDYFLHRGPPPDSWRAQHPAARIGLVIAKNLCGVLLVLVGIIQSVPVLVPGFGLLTILIGILLLNFPGKRALELRIMRNTTVLRAVNAVRAKAGRAPIEMPN
jgi:hypothetical protein